MSAESVGATTQNGQLHVIPVRPDWSDGSDLLGYRDLKGEFHAGPLTKVLVEASRPANVDKPFFVVLDEMNLARVEYYFSDVLSVMESREWKDNRIQTDVILPESLIGQAISIPDNVYIIGTVNMDETTHPFSKKVLDRANTIELNQIELEYFDFIELEEAIQNPMLLTKDRFTSEYLKLINVFEKQEDLVREISKKLVKINESLAKMGAQVGYRVRDEICFYMAYNAEFRLLSEDEAFDFCLMQKILPRIAGTDNRVETVLRELYSFTTNMEWNGQEDVIGYAIYPKSSEKIARMLRGIENDGFTSFWL